MKLTLSFVLWQNKTYLFTYLIVGCVQIAMENSTFKTIVYEICHVVEKNVNTIFQEYWKVCLLSE